MDDSVGLGALKLAIDQSVYVVVSDLNGAFIEVNERFVAVTGHTKEFLLQEKFQVLESGHHPKGFHEDILQDLSSGRSWRGEMRLKSKGGFLFWVEMSIIPISEKVYYIGHDITERKGTEEFLADSQTFSKTLMQEAPIGMLLASTSGACTYVNDMWLSFCGLKLREVMGGGWMKAIHPDDFSQVTKSWEAFLAEDGPFQCQYRYRRGDGHETWVFASAIRLKNSQGKTSGILRTEQNLNDYIAKEKVIADQQLAMASSSKLASLGEMAAGIAHEINNPLAIISLSMRGARKMLAKGVNIPEMERIFCDIDETIVRITKIINGLRNVSRESSGESFSDCKVLDCIQEVLVLCQERFKVHGIGLSVEADEGLKDQKMDLMQVEFSQVLLNLLGNAFDEVEKQGGGWVRVMVEVCGEKIIFKVMDSGKGIPKEIQDKIFQPFFTTKGVGKGTGLGLSISHSIIAKHQGQFYVDNDCQNTCFVIVLPLRQKKRAGG